MTAPAEISQTWLLKAYKSGLPDYETNIKQNKKENLNGVSL